MKNIKSSILLTALMMVNVIFLFLIWWKVYEYVNINMEDEILLSSKNGIEYICMDMIAAAVYVIGIVLAIAGIWLSAINGAKIPVFITGWGGVLFIVSLIVCYYNENIIYLAGKGELTQNYYIGTIYAIISVLVVTFCIFFRAYNIEMNKALIKENIISTIIIGINFLFLPLVWWQKHDMLIGRPDDYIMSDKTGIEYMHRVGSIWIYIMALVMIFAAIWLMAVRNIRRILPLILMLSGMVLFIVSFFIKDATEIWYMENSGGKLTAAYYIALVYAIVSVLIVAGINIFKQCKNIIN
ncbi:MAG: hypothetical protein ACLRVQ_03895 [Lachnospiraceae bacterium]